MQVRCAKNSFSYDINITLSIFFRPYLRNFKICKKKLANVPEDATVWRDENNNFVYNRVEIGTPEIIRFSDYNPKSQPEGFFYNLLLEKVSFRDELKLLSSCNTAKSYQTECMIQNIINFESDIELYVEDYCRRHLFECDKVGSLIQQLMARFDTLDAGPCVDSTMKSNDNDAYTALRLPSLQELSVETDVMEGGSTTRPLLPEQQMAFDSITRAGTGLFLITGGPGSGKTFLTRRLAKHFRAKGDDTKVLLAGSTGASSVRLSKHASTVHTTFALSKHGPLLIGINHRCRSLLEQAKVIFIDEMSMLNTDLVGGIFFQLRKIHHCMTNTELFQKLLVVFVGDHAQLPPVCRHNTEGCDKVCEQCHLGHSLWWPMMTKIELKCHPRTAGDQDFSDFLDIARKRMPSQPEYDRAIGKKCKHITPQRALEMVARNNAVALCSHKNDVKRYNDAAIKNIFSTDKIIEVPINHTGGDIESRMTKWLADDDFHTLKTVAVGARVLVTENMMDLGVANGSTGTVMSIDFDLTEEEKQNWSKKKKKRKGEIEENPVFVFDGTGDREKLLGRRIKSINIKVDGDTSGKVVRITESAYDRKDFDSKTIYKRAFPLALSYAMTGHRSQGATIKSDVIIDVRDAFVPGLLYVMISRVERRSQIHIVGKLKNSMFMPIILPEL